MSRLIPSIDPTEPINPSMVNWIFPTLGNKTYYERKKGMSFKLVIKNGSSDHKFDAKTGTYKTKTVDDVRTYESLAEALAEFLYSVGDDYNTNKISITFTPKKKK